MAIPQMIYNPKAKGAAAAVPFAFMSNFTGKLRLLTQGGVKVLNSYLNIRFAIGHSLRMMGGLRMSRIVVLVGSNRKGGNTDLLAKAFADGASDRHECRGFQAM